MPTGKIVFVTGVPGAGKTAIARELGRRNNWQVVDIDDDCRRLFGPVSTAVDTHTGLNRLIGEEGHRVLFQVAEFWAEHRPKESVIFVVPMIRRKRQQMLSGFQAKHPDRVVTVFKVYPPDNPVEIERRLASRRAEGYVGGVDTLCEYLRVKETEESLESGYYHPIHNSGSLQVAVQEIEEILQVLSP